MSKVYIGSLTGINGDDYQVSVFRSPDGPLHALNPHFELVNHSPDGFCWGYGGSGPAQLAFAMLFDAVGRALAQRHYLEFKDLVIARLPMDKPFELSEDKVKEMITLLELRRK